MIMHQGIDKVQSLIWRIKFYNRERKAHSLVRSIKHFALCWWLARGPLGTTASLLICDECKLRRLKFDASASHWVSHSYRCATTASDVGPVQSIHYTLLADIVAQSPIMLDEWRQTVYWATLGTGLWPWIIHNRQFFNSGLIALWLSKHRRQSKIWPYIFGGLSPQVPDTRRLWLI